MLNKSHNKAVCSAMLSFLLTFLFRHCRHCYYHRSHVSLTWSPFFVFESVFHLDSFTGKFASNCFWKSHFHWDPCQKEKELRAVMADTWTASNVVRDKVYRKDRPGGVSWMKQEKQDENTVTYVRRMRRHGGIFRSLKIVDIKLFGTMFSWYMNRIAWAMLAVEITKRIALKACTHMWKTSEIFKLLSLRVRLRKHFLIQN